MSFDTILAKSPSIIYRPGVASSKLAVETWAEVQAFIALRTGAVIVYVDDSVTSPAPVPGASGITDCGGRVEIRSALTDSLGTSVLVIQDGATLRDLSIIRGVEVQCDTQGVTPALDFTSVDGGNLLLKDFSTLSNANTATQPAILIANGKTLFLNMEEGALILNAPAVPLFSVAAGGLLQMWALDATSLSAANPGFASGAGNVELNYDNASASFFGLVGDPTPPALPGITGAYTKTNVDNVWATKAIDPATFNAPAVGNVPTFDGTKWQAQAPSGGGVSVVTATFLVTTVNALAAMQAGGQLPAAGIIPVRVDGFGGGGGAPGNQGGSPTAGSGGGGAQYHSTVIYIDLSHAFDVNIGPAGLGSLGTPNGSGIAPNDGTAGGPTTILDSTAGQTIWAALGANGATAIGSATGFSGQPGGCYADPGGTITQPVPNPSTSGTIIPINYLPGSGGRGGQNAGVNASAGSAAMTSLGGLFEGGAGGTNGGAGTNTDGHGGGGGAAGPLGPGGVGGNGTPVGSGLPGGNGTSAAANTGAGGGAGGGGPNGGPQNGSNGGDGGSGWMRMTFYVGATIVS